MGSHTLATACQVRLCLHARVLLSTAWNGWQERLRTLCDGTWALTPLVTMGLRPGGHVCGAVPL